jgi:serine/threonine-protein kinase RsbW
MTSDASSSAPNGEAASPPCEPARLSIPNDPRLAGAAGRFMSEVARLIGFDDEMLQDVADGVRLSLDALLRYSFAPGENAFIDLAGEWIPAGLQISIRDRGLPLDAQATVAAGSADSPLYGLNAYFDEVRFHNRGRDGKELVLIKHLPDPSVGAFAAACEAGSLGADDVGPARADAGGTCSVRPLTPADALEVSQTVYRVYGYSYPHEYVYYPEKIAELNRTGAIFSAVAVADGTEIAGHCSLKPWEDNPQVAELTQGVVKPPYRSRGCFTRLTAYLIDTARARGMTGIFGEAVTNHPYSQKTALQFGLRACALLLGVIPASADFKGLGGSLAERGSMLVQFMYLRQPDPAPVYAPAAHRDVIAATYANLGRNPELRAPDPAAAAAWAEDSRITVRLVRSLNLARIRVDRCGRDLLDALSRHVRELSAREWKVIHLMIGLSDPAAASLCPRFEELGFFFAGILPCGLPSGDALILQHLNRLSVRHGAIRTASEFGATLAAYVRQRDPNLS